MTQPDFIGEFLIKEAMADRYQNSLMISYPDYENFNIKSSGDAFLEYRRKSRMANAYRIKDYYDYFNTRSESADFEPMDI